MKETTTQTGAGDTAAQKIKTISTGFLSGNLGGDSSIDLDASAEAYAFELEAALKEAYPDAEITVDFQDAYGCVPRPLQTSVEFEGECDCAAQEDAIRDVDNICERIFERATFWVEAGE